MEFVKEFTVFLYKKGALKFGDFTLSSGKKSSYYIDLRVVPSFPHQFRRMVKSLQSQISEEIGLDNFDSYASIPTSGLIIASALAIETVKPLIYVRTKPKDYGTSKLVEGNLEKDLKVLLIDDVATTGGSVANAISALKKADTVLTDAYVIINRLEGADKLLDSHGVKLRQIMDILEITSILHKENLIDDEILNKVKNQVSLS